MRLDKMAGLPVHPHKQRRVSEWILAAAGLFKWAQFLSRDLRLLLIPLARERRLPLEPVVRARLGLAPDTCGFTNSTGFILDVRR